MLVYQLTIDIGKTISDVAFWPTEGLPGLLSNIAGILIIFAAIISFFYLIMGGVRWITSSGNKEQLTAAQQTVTTALTGLVIVFAAWAILSLVKQFFGLSGGVGVPGGPGPQAGCTAPTGEIGNDGPGGCCGNFTSQEGNSCTSGNCRSHESCQVTNGACASNTSCCVKTSQGGCSNNSDCCSNNCQSGQCL